jgi:hypothetical protein
MRTVLGALGLIVVATGVASANPGYVPAGIGPTSTACAAAIDQGDSPPQGARCTETSAVAIPGLGKATVVVLANDDGWYRYVLVVTGKDASGDIRVVSQPLEYMGSCGMHKCIEVSYLAPKLRAVKVGGKPAAVLEVRTDYVKSRTDPDTGASTSESWSRTTFLACGLDRSDAIKCTNVVLGGEGDDCRSSLDADGTVHTTCEQRDVLSLE